MQNTQLINEVTNSRIYQNQLEELLQIFNNFRDNLTDKLFEIICNGNSELLCDIDKSSFHPMMEERVKNNLVLERVYECHTSIDTLIINDLINEAQELEEEIFCKKEQIKERYDYEKYLNKPEKAL
ncbi:hypothetical protein LJ707_18755 [Mucilaginibacter sp. UR6-1]|uniref:hypothetical protein n=1 Tax=Mucilaginibacter sp. UR6-1 TaxID=1435643 RepID=UPI001E4696CE|nr:hypothetical protein [Mucilaginibacter sp. UR6-1]MCC8410987.1 hypothetical protein [Mucilaginibacter sp. UR6-1]